MRIQSETKSLPSPLTPEELAEESKLLAEADLAVQRQEELLTIETAKWKDAKKKLEECLGYLKTQAAAQLEIVHSESKEKEVPCSWLYALGAGYAFLVRDDTQELVHHRKLGDQERQTDLLEVIREPTPEQLKGWVESLGLVLEPQQGLPLAAPEEPIRYYRDFVLTTAAGNERITARFKQADHRPESLDGVHSHGEPGIATGLPEQVNRAKLTYEEEPALLQAYRAALEDLLAEKAREALKSRQEPTSEPAEALKTASVPKRRKEGKG
jgi:hypothetical protein